MAQPPPSAPLFTITETDKSGVIMVVTIVTLAFSVVCFLTRVYVRLRMNGPWSYDDTALSAAMVMAVAQSAAVFLQVGESFGKAEELLSVENIASMGKADFAANLLYLVALYLSKLSGVALIMRLTSIREHLLVTWTIVAASTIWILSSILLITVRCSPAAPLVEVLAQCSGLFARWQYICALDAVTDFAIFAMSVYLVSGLQMAKRGKALVVLAFALRLPTIAAAGVRLYYLHRVLHSADPTLTRTFVQVWTQIEMNYSLMATAMASLGSFIRPFTKAYMADTRYPRSRSNPPSAAGRYNLSKLSSTGYLKHSQSSNSNPMPAPPAPNPYPNFQPPERWRPNLVTHDIRGTARPSHESHDSKCMMITKDVQWTVEEVSSSESAGVTGPRK